MKRVTFALAICLGCAPVAYPPTPATLDVAADVGFTATERAAILDATLDLYATRAIRARVEFTADMADGVKLADQAAGYLLLRSDPISPLVETMDGYSPGYRALGWVSADNRRAWLVPDRCGKALGHVAEHEMGHLAGLEHEPSGVMEAVVHDGARVIGGQDR